MKRTLTIAVILLFTMIGPNAWGELDLTNTELTKIQGQVEVKKNTMPAFKAVPSNLKLAGALKRLDSGDKVKTQTQSGAEMILKETCLLTVKEKTLFEVPAVIGQAALTQLKANQGSFLFKVISGSDFKVQTADVVAGVKGTLFEVEIVDDLRSILSLPNLEIGLEGAGGTSVNVFEGEVDLQHSQTGKSRRLKAGEGLSALGRKLFSLDQTLADGFSPLRKFNPLQKVQERFGALGRALQGIPSSRLGLLGFKSEGLSSPLGLGKLNERFSRLFDGIGGNLRGKLEGLSGIRSKLEQVGQNLKDLKQNLQDLKGEEFVPKVPEGKYPVLQNPITVPEKRVEEAHLGGGLFVSMQADDGCPSLKVKPDQEGLALEEGEGTFHIRDFAGDLDAYVTTRTIDGRLVSQIQVKKGSLAGRLAEEKNMLKITPQAPFAFAMTKDGRGEVIRANPQNPIPQEIANQHFAVETEIEAQRAEHDKKVNAKRKDAAQNLLNKANQKSGGSLTDGLKGTKSDVKNKIRGLFGS